MVEKHLYMKQWVISLQCQTSKKKNCFYTIEYK